MMEEESYLIFRVGFVIFGKQKAKDVVQELRGTRAKYTRKLLLFLGVESMSYSKKDYKTGNIWVSNKALNLVCKF